MRTTTIVRGLVTACLALALAACGGDGGDEAAERPGDGEDEVGLDEITSEEEARFAVDPLRFPEMQDGRLDTVDVIGRTDDGEAAWHVQAIAYAEPYTSITYAAWYTGADSTARFAADHQPYLEDEEGNRYTGLAVPSNPRIDVVRETTAVGVYVFTPGLEAGADSLTMFVNDSTAPVIRIGPWSVADAGGGGTGLGAEARPE